MPKPYSQDLRERVVHAVEEGQPPKHRIIKKMCPTLPILISLSVIRRGLRGRKKKSAQACSLRAMN